MAQSLRRPLLGLVRCSPCISPRRQCFSQLTSLRAASSGQTVRPRQAAEPSMRIRSKEASAIPNDVGLLEKTWIHPTSMSSFGLLQNPLRYFKLQYHRLTFRLRDLVSLYALKMSSPKDKGFFRRSLKLHRYAIKPTALELHKQMYTAFADADTLSLRKICADGIFESFCSRIASRRKSEKVVWELIKYNRRPRIVSNRAARIPIEGAAIRQVVVRICSRQKLTRWRLLASGRELVPGTGGERDVVEYVVMQMNYQGWKAPGWQIWGTTKENTYEDIETWRKELL